MPVWQPPVGTRTEVEHVTGLHQNNLGAVRRLAGKQENRNCICIPRPYDSRRKRCFPQSLSNQALKPLLSDLLPHLLQVWLPPSKSHQLQGCPDSVQRPCGNLVDRITRLQLHLGAYQGQVASDTLIGWLGVHPPPQKQCLYQ